MCKLHKNDLYFFTLNNGTGTINNIDIRHKKVYDTNMEPVPITNRGDSYNRDRKTKIGTGYTTKYRNNRIDISVTCSEIVPQETEGTETAAEAN